jgi:UDP-N-acetylglucosamine acyltransferase
VTIGPWCHVGRHVVLEEGVRLVSHVVIDGHTTIGAGAVLYPFCSVGLPPQDMKYKGEPTSTVIGARTQIREHCTIHRGTVTGSGITRVGADCLLMAVVHVAHDCTLGDGVIVANNVVMGGHVVIGGASGVEADVIPFGTVLGNRARLTGLNIVGLRRRGVDRAGLHRLRAAFRSLFPADDDGAGVFAERLARLREADSDSLVAEMMAFIEAPSRRGLVRRAIARADDEES